MMKGEIQSLSAELRKIQSENIELYAKLANLRKEKSQLQPKEEDDSNNDFKNQIEAIMKEQKKEASKRTAAQKQLQSLINELKQIQTEIDDQKSNIQNNLLPVLNAEEELTNQFYQDVLVKCKQKADSSCSDHRKIESLISQISQKTKEYFESQDEIEKYNRLIVINENPIPNSAKDGCYPPDFHYNVQGLNKARIRNRVLFKFDNF